MIVLLHGVGVGARYFAPLAAELGPAVSTPELREPLPIAAVAERLAEALAGPSLVVGHSSGCQVAAELAATRPELVSGLVLVGPPVDPRARSLARQTARVLRDAWYEPPRLSLLVVADYFRTGPLETLRQARHALAHRLEERLPHIVQPTVVVRGAHDPVCPEHWARQVASLVPRGRLVTIAGAAHDAHFSHPREVARIVEQLRDGAAE